MKHLLFNAIIVVWLGLALVPRDLLAASPPPTPDPADLAQRQCRSVHLSYQHPPANAACIELIPEQSAAGTYFCALGFRMGYFGVQELVDGSHLALFSVWDASDQEKSITDAKDRVTLIKKGDSVQVQRFGGEGTGAQSKRPFAWKIGEPVTFFLQSTSLQQHTRFTAHLYDRASQRWLLMATFQTRAHHLEIEGLYSFIEDFQRNGASAQQRRRARFINGGIRVNGNWQSLQQARFTADATPSPHIDAGSLAAGFFLQTGGNTQNRTTALNQVFHHDHAFLPPPSLPVEPQP